MTVYARKSVGTSVGLLSCRVHPGSLVALLPKAVVRFQREARGMYLYFINFSTRYAKQIGLVGGVKGTCPGLLRRPIMPLSRSITNCLGSCFTLLSQTDYGRGFSVSPRLMRLSLRAVLADVQLVCRGCPKRGDDSGHGGRVYQRLVRSVARRCGSRHHTRFCTSRLKVSLRRLDAAIERMANGDMLSAVTCVIVVSTGTGLGKAGVAVRRVTCSLGFPDTSFFNGCFGQCIKVAPLRFEGEWLRGGKITG